MLIIGGGIVGAGIARDAAMRGLRTAIVEQQDFASGTSSRSTRLLHGGIRYLAQGNVGLVREANREKSVIRRIAPHLAEPLPFVFPARKGIGWPKWQLAIGVKVYDFLCGQEKLGLSRALGAAETMAAVPELNSDGLTGSVLYFDALTNDARLVIDTLRSALRHDAAVCNYVRFVGADRRKNIWRAKVVDSAAGGETTVEAACLVNATGPWSDTIPGSNTDLRLTKGVHLVISRSRLPISNAVVAVERNRILFAIPWGERVILGTTDTDYSGSLSDPICEPEDQQYVLDSFNTDFSGVRLTPEDVLSTWAGLRPLVADRRGKPSDISRRHQINMSQPGWWDVTGGKLTTYRLMAEETVDLIARYLGRTLPACSTATSPLLANGGATESSDILPPEVSQPLVEHYCRNEWARGLDDVMIRRTSWRHYLDNHEIVAEKVAAWMATELDWSSERMASELKRYRELTGSQERGSGFPTVE